MPAWYDQLMTVFTLDNTPLLISAAITFVIGYLEYVYSFALIRRENLAPYPVWMHTFYLAHDSSWAVIMFIAAAHHGWYWFFTAVGAALLVWNLFEIYNLYKVITVERQEIWGAHYNGDVTVGQAIFNVVLQLGVFYCLVNVLIGFMGQGSIMQWFLFTNMLIAAAPGVLWMKRGAQNGTRYGTSIGLGIVILLGTINTFHPWSMWVLSLPEVFNTPWYYITGVIFTAIAAHNLYRVLKLPPKVPTEEIPRPVW